MQASAVARSLATHCSRVLKLSSSPLRHIMNAAKRARVDPDILQLLNYKGTSDKALDGLLKKLPTQCRMSTYVMRQIYESIYTPLRHVEVLPTNGGGEFRWEFLNPCLLVSALVNELPFMQELYAPIANRKRSDPWDIVIIFDEFVPGSKRCLDTNRKCMNLLFNFDDIGADARTNDFTWFFPVSVRTDMMESVRGGWSCMMKRFLNEFLFGVNGVESVGIPLQLFGETYLLRAKLRVLLTDGGAWPMTLQWGGPSCIRPCFKHGNVLRRGCVLSAAAGTDFVEIQCADPSCFARVQHSHLYDDVDSVVEAKRLRAADPTAMSQAELKRVQYVTGLNATSDGLLADKVLRSRIDILDVMWYDWAHTYLQDGALNHELAALLQACSSKLGLPPSFWELCLKDGWSFPQQHKVKSKLLHRIFNAYRMAADDDNIRVSGMMSELLGVSALIRHIVETDHRLQSAEIAAERDCFLTLCRGLDILMDAKRFRLELPEAAQRLRDAHAEYMRKAVATHGIAHIRPKCHWVFDIADQMVKYFYDTFVIERIHLRAKSIAQHVKDFAKIDSMAEAFRHVMVSPAGFSLSQLNYVFCVFFSQLKYVTQECVSLVDNNVFANTQQQQTRK